ncbi:MAG: hypothetical protein M1834_000985 [Cirrosporium novae-zelandiae]|nr:MAG: hypothetical protein M1834_000985 [Cirrosporium novae-zelandiae]
MVSTRSHPDNFPDPAPTPSRSSRSRTSTPTRTSFAKSSPPITPPYPSTRRSQNRTTTTRAPKAWSHTPSSITLAWLLISVPLVIWDCGYVLLRPDTMPGGRFHNPLYVPYATYAKTDYMYGWPAWEAKNGFTSAQGSVNVVECVMYIYYLWIVWRGGNGREVTPSRRAGRERPRIVESGRAARAVLVLFAASVMTFSKTALYWLNEYFSSFENVRHNDTNSLILYWIIPNGLWLLFPSYIIYVSSSEILQGLSIASSSSSYSFSNSYSPPKEEEEEELENSRYDYSKKEK